MSGCFSEMAATPALLGLAFSRDLVHGSTVLALISTAVVAGLFAYMGRRAQHRVFDLWALGWMLFSVYLAGRLAEGFLAGDWATEALPALFVGASALLMWCGDLEMLDRPVSRNRIALFAAGLMGAGVGAEYMGWGMWSENVAFLLLSLGVATAGVLYFRAGKPSESTWVATGGFLFWAVATAGSASFGNLHGWATLSMSVSAMCLIAIALGVIIEQEVKYTEQKYRSVLDGNTDSIFMVDLWTLKILDVNQAAARFVRAEPQQLVGASFLELCPDLRNEGENVLDHRKMFAAVFKPFSEFHLARSDGAMVLCEGDTSLVQWHSRPVMQVRVREAKSDLQMSQLVRRAEKMSSLGQLIAGVAHELNNPLAVVVAYAQMLGKKTVGDPELRENMQRILHESERAAKIVRDLLTFALPCEPQLTTVDLNQLVCNVLDIRERDFTNNKIELRTHFRPGLSRTKADPIQIEQVLNNLVTNALHAMAGAQGKRILRVITEETNFFVRITVSDTGCGIAPEIVSKIFDPFFTTKPPGKGTGLGLSISHSILQEHHGKIWVESELGKGTSFHLEIPVVACEQEAAKAEPLPAGSGVGDVEENRRRLLVVDDEAGIREVLELILTGQGYEVVTAGNGAEAMERIHAEKFDLIISDMHMPEMDGEKLFELIREKDEAMTERVVFVTGDTVSAKSRSFLERTGVRWLGKPFNIKDVEDTVGDLLKSSDSKVDAALKELLK
jgi:PAS domain S-box-containing protein